MQYQVYIKVKSDDDKRFSFLTPRFGTTYLRVHAARFDIPTAESIIRDIYENNTDFTAKMVPISS